jgi:hypothetical protein
MIRFHVEAHDERVSEEDQVLDCHHNVSKGIPFTLYMTMANLLCGFVRIV